MSHILIPLTFRYLRFFFFFFFVFFLMIWPAALSIYFISVCSLACCTTSLFYQCLFLCLPNFRFILSVFVSWPAVLPVDSISVYILACRTSGLFYLCCTPGLLYQCLFLSLQHFWCLLSVFVPLPVALLVSSFF